MRKYFSLCTIISASVFLAHIFFINIPNISAAISLRDEAVSYREKGYEVQKTGDINTAMVWYQKAVELDPEYAAPHNDLGILFETKGWLDRAEAEYQKSIILDPNYGKAHTNLALLYERKGELEKAAFHWMRRYKLGSPGDAWTDEARQRLEKLGLIDVKDIARKALPAKEQGDIESSVESEKKDAGGWTRLGSEKKEAAKKKPEKKKKVERVRPKPKKKEAAEELKPKKREVEKPPNQSRSLSRAESRGSGTGQAKEPEKAEKDKWSMLGSTKKKEDGKKIAKKTRPSDLDKELRESLRLAEERLKKEKRVEQGTAKKKTVKKIDVSSGSRSHYARAENYYKKGEYSRALDIIRTAKKDYPDDEALLELEQTIKNKMKEERIEDHYYEGLMRYDREDYTGARKEFEAILDILPE
ncbi:MAG: tetratricopeptide repeat protein [Candidatus Omnitrophica bacterium]|nr:tetratricopeptide repeat protein [Candidatus Omnitrophota bacterium]